MMNAKNYYVLLCFMLLFASCKQKETFYTYSLPDEANLSLTSTVWQTADSSRFYYDLRITPSYYVFLDDKNDTVIRVYSKNNAFTLYNSYIKKQNILDAEINFLKSNTRNQLKDNELWITDNSYTVKTLCPDNKDEIISKTSSNILKMLPNTCMDYNVTTNEIYAVEADETQTYPYYFFRPDSGYYWVDMYKYPNTFYPMGNHVYLCNLAVNEKANSAVCAMRFMNDILFYDLHGQIKTVVSIGDKHIVPVTTPDEVDIKQSTKCFIYVCGTDKHVYCLYDGSIDYNANSKIFVFNWDGKHIATFQTDKCLKQIAVDESKSYILALAANKDKGRDVVILNMPKF